MRGSAGGGPTLSLATRGNTMELEQTLSNVNGGPRNEGTLTNTQNLIPGVESEQTGTNSETTNPSDPVPLGSGDQLTQTAEKDLEKKRLSGAQKKKLTRERKIAEGTWVESKEFKKTQNKDKPGSSYQGLKRPRSPNAHSSGHRPGELAKQCRSSTEPTTSHREGLSGVKMAIVPENYPEIKLSEEQGEQLQYALVENMTCPEGEGVPQFRSTKWELGALVVTCNNEYSRQCLELTVKQIKWEGTLVVDEARQLLRTTKIIMRIPKFFNNHPLEGVLKMVETQNTGLQAKQWHVLHKSAVGPDGQTIVCAIEERELKTLQEMRFKIFIGFGSITVKVLEDQQPQHAQGIAARPSRY